MNINKSRTEIIKNVKTYIGTRGYIIKKKFFTEKELNEVREDNTVKPFTTNDYGVEEEPFQIYLESENKIYLPKFYGLDRFGKPEADVLPEGHDIDIDFSLTLKEEQKIPAQCTIKAYEEKGGGILSLPCGFGKTILALYFISILKKRTIVIVHKEFLMNQWIERIKFALPNAKVGIVQANKCQIEGYDIIIGMLQTLSMREFPENTFDSIGHVIIDECHRIPSRVFSKALMRINSKYMLGLSATPNRKDGLTKVLKYNIGDIIYSVKSHDKNIVKVERYLLNSDDENYNKTVSNFRGSAQSSTMINNIARCRNRTELIVQIIIDEINKDENRQILVLSDRREHLDEICNLSKLKGLESVGYYVGGMKKEKLKESESCRLILGTYPMAKEGLDIPSLNGLILATPISDIVQSIGRIDRIKHSNIVPLIVDIVDKFSIYENQSRKRFALFKKKKYQIEDIHYDLDRNKKGMSKNYFFHNIKDTEKSDTEKSDSEYEDKELSSVKKTKQPIKINKDMSGKDIDDLFKEYAFS
jgi:superfamily II DNA or RNA helicase